MKRTITVFALALTAMTGCSLIDEKVKDCPEEITVTCSLNLNSNKDQEMDEKLGTEHDLPIRAALEDYLQHVFVRSVHEVDMYFYDLTNTSKPLREVGS